MSWVSQKAIAMCMISIFKTAVNSRNEEHLDQLVKNKLFLFSLSLVDD